MKTQENKTKRTLLHIKDRTYFFDVKIDADDKKYLAIADARAGGSQCEVVIYEDGLNSFLKGLQSILLSFDIVNDFGLAEMPSAEMQSDEMYDWTESDDARLQELFNSNHSVSELVNIFQRNEGAIRARLEQLLLSRYEPSC